MKGKGMRSGGGRTFNNDHAGGFVAAQMVGGHAFVLARVTWLTVNDLYGDHTIGVTDSIV